MKKERLGLFRYPGAAKNPSEAAHWLAILRKGERRKDSGCNDVVHVLGVLGEGVVIPPDNLIWDVVERVVI